MICAELRIVLAKLPFLVANFACAPPPSDRPIRERGGPKRRQQFFSPAWRIVEWIVLSLCDQRCGGGGWFRLTAGQGRATRCETFFVSLASGHITITIFSVIAKMFDVLHPHRGGCAGEGGDTFARDIGKIKRPPRVQLPFRTFTGRH